MPSQCHYRGDRVDALVVMADTGWLFGPDMCGPANPGQILGNGALYELVSADYDKETDRTLAKFKPHVDPRTRIRYHGGEEETPLIGGVDTGLAQHDSIGGR